jgi:dienelactone hydrolase
MYKIWYPSDADVAGKERDPYVDPASRSGFATKYGLPANALNYLDRVKTHVYQGLPVANGSFPVLIFSHGYGSKATGYYAMLSELASQGYIIINMNHTYESLGATFPNGEMKFFDYEFQHKISSASLTDIEPLQSAFRDGLSYEERHPIVSKSVKNFYESQSMDRWAEDITETIDLLETWNSDGSLAGKMDLDKLGVFGHSNGGGSAGKVPLIDQRVKAAANIDGITWGNLIDTTYQIPFLYISADWPADHEDINSHVYINKSTDLFYEAKLLQSGHPNFMDIPFMIPVPALAGTGAIDPYDGTKIVNELITSFFDRHLKNKEEANPAAIDEQYPLLQMTVHTGDSIKYKKMMAGDL